MTEKPINLHPHEARAAAEGRLGLIVRPVVPQPIPFEPFSDPPSKEELESAGKPWWPHGGIHIEFWPCPIGQPGARLWAREVWRQYSRVIECACYEECQCPPNGTVLYRAAADDEEHWRSPVTMPRWASRFTFEVEAVECRRVQEITNYDALEAGIDTPKNLTKAFEAGEYLSHRNRFMQLWDSHYAKRGLGWDANPWAWFVRVRRV